MHDGRNRVEHTLALWWVNALDLSGVSRPLLAEHGKKLLNSEKQAQAKRAQQSIKQVTTGRILLTDSAKPDKEGTQQASRVKSSTGWHKHWGPSSHHSQAATTSMSATFSRLVVCMQGLEWPACISTACKLASVLLAWCSTIEHHVFGVFP